MQREAATAHRQPPLNARVGWLLASQPLTIAAGCVLGNAWPCHRPASSRCIGYGPPYSPKNEDDITPVPEVQ
ncbi:hypothetical protein B0T24DRAFT_189632 [Lasiosphaeria ovina]|uniref:Uncharacterized protein n=1 Tax=Lasiosphaeria ovina TaxID=92902 RepID=A0AAE0NF27_9PEZI|nr:hypothetical protein B0T24DRAFT_189632 [Lasiosphaeria ovina]